MKKSKTTKKETAKTQTVKNAETPIEQKPLSKRALQLFHLRNVSEQARKVKESMIEGATTPKQRDYFQNRPLNYFILNCVYSGSTKQFKTFEQWQKEGASIKKGEKAYLIWGQPVIDEKRNDQSGEPVLFYPVSNVFSSTQVTFKTTLQPSEAMPF